MLEGLNEIKGFVIIIIPQLFVATVPEPAAVVVTLAYGAFILNIKD